MDRVRVALIGAGGMANAVHYPSLAEFDDVDMVALCDIDEEKLNKTADRFGIPKRYTNYREMLDAENADAVYILMPPHQLFDLTMDTIDRGLNVFIEKPPGITSGQTHQMAVAAERKGIVGMVGFNRRHAPIIVEARRRALERGPMLQCVATFYKAMAGAEPHPYYRGAIDILHCDAVHAVDMLRFMGGDVVNVASDVQAHGVTYDNMFNALVRFESGGVGVLLTNWNVGGRRHEFEMHSVGFTAYVNPDEVARIWADGRSEPEVLDTKQVAGSDEMRIYYGFTGENRHFIDCVKSGEQPNPNFADATKSMELVKRIYAASW